MTIHSKKTVRNDIYTRNTMVDTNGIPTVIEDEDTQPIIVQQPMLTGTPPLPLLCLCGADCRNVDPADIRVSVHRLGIAIVRCPACPK